MSLQSKRVLITGASTGFGRLMVERFLEANWHVLATTRSPERFSSLQHERLQILPYNVADPEGRQQIASYLLQHCDDTLHCLINNAGYGVIGPMEAATEPQIRQQLEVNFFAPLLLTQALLPALRKTQGRVINISSVLGFAGMPMQSLYTASKFALEGLSESLHYELAPHGVQVALVEPGGFRTDFGKQADWTDPSPLAEHPVYSKQFQGYRNFFTRLTTQGKGNDPNRVARVIVRLAACNKMPLRTRVGLDTQAVYYVRRFTPQRMADTILGQLTRSLMEV